MGKFATPEEELHGVTPMDALDNYRQRVPPAVREGMEMFLTMPPNERLELLFYMLAGLSEIVAVAMFANEDDTRH